MPPRDEKGRFIARPKSDPAVAEQIRHSVDYTLAEYGDRLPPIRRTVSSSASYPRPRASIVHDPVPEKRRRVWPRIVVVVLVAMAAAVAIIVWAVTHR